MNDHDDFGELQAMAENVADPGPVAAPPFGPAAGVAPPPPVITARARPQPLPETRSTADPLGDLAEARERARDKADAAAATAAAGKRVGVVLSLKVLQRLGAIII